MCEKYNDVRWITGWIKVAKKKINKLKKEYKEYLKKREVLKVIMEEKYLILKIDNRLSNLIENKAEFVEDMKKNINEVENMMEKYNDLYSRIELVFVDDYVEQFGKKFRVNEKKNGVCSKGDTTN